MSEQAIDPIIPLIDAYNAGRTKFFEINPHMKDEDQLWEDLVGCHYSIIVCEPPPITTMQGARAALGFIKNNEDRDFEDDAPIKLVLAVATFIEGIEA